MDMLYNLIAMPVRHQERQPMGHHARAEVVE